MRAHPLVFGQATQPLAFLAQRGHQGRDLHAGFHGKRRALHMGQGEVRTFRLARVGAVCVKGHAIAKIRQGMGSVLIYRGFAAVCHGFQATLPPLKVATRAGGGDGRQFLASHRG